MEKFVVVGNHIWAHRLKIGLLLLLAFVAGYLIRFSLYGGGIPKANGAVSNTSGRLIILEDKLEFAALESKLSPEKTVITKEVKDIAQERKNDLLKLVKSDPAEARKLLLSAESSKTLRDRGVTNVEEYVSLTGRYGFMQVADEHSDSGEHGDHFYQQIVTPEGKTYTINTEQMLPKITHGSTVKTTGFVIDDQLLVDAAPGADVIYSYNAEDNVTAATSSTAAPISTITQAATITSVAQQNILVLMGNFSGTSNVLDADKLKSYYNNLPGYDLAGYVSEVSSGTASLNPTFMGTYDYVDIACSSNQMAHINALKDTVAGQADFNAYSVIVYATNCNTGSIASWGGSGPKTNYIGYSSDPDTHRSSITHEFAHTLGSGISHGGYLSCGIDVFIPPTNNLFESNGCQVAEYDDPYDVLGERVQGFTGHLSVSHKLDAGWLDSTRVPTLSSTGTYTYTLEPLENNSGIVGLKIPRGGGRAGYFTVEYRQPIGKDSYINTNACSKCNAHTGAIIRLAGMKFSGPGGGADSNMLDSTPGSNVSTTAYWPTGDGRDGAFAPGKSVTDPEYGITISVLSQDAAGLKVEVKLEDASCLNNTPTISAVSPSVLTALPGQSKTYSATVTNTDTAGCKPQTFRYSATSRALDYASLLARGKIDILMAPDTFTLAPGESRQVALNVTSSENVPDGKYFSSAPLLGHIYSKSYGVPSVSIPSFTYEIATPADVTPPSVPANLTATPLGSSAVKFDWSPAEDNARVIAYEITLSNGATYRTTETSQVVLALTPSTAYTATIRAVDGKQNFSAHAQAEFTMKAKTDAIPPKKPGLFTISASDHSVNLLWSPTSDNQVVACYLLIVSGYGQQCSQRGALANYSMVGLTSNSMLTNALVAFDGDGNVAIGPSQKYSTAVEGDSATPSAPGQIYVSSQTLAGGTQLKWGGSSDNTNVVGYNIFRGCCWAGFTNTNSYTVASRNAGSVRIQAVDSDGSLSSQGYDQWLPAGPYQTSSDTEAPSASVRAPIAHTVVSGIATLESDVTDNVGVTSVNYYIDGALLGTSTVAPNFPLQFDTQNYLEGKHWLVALASDAARNNGSAGPTDLIFTNGGDATPPEVTITSPSNGASLSGPVTIDTQVTDDKGIAEVSFQVDGRVIATDKQAPYSANWDASKLTNGPHTITVIASDTAGNSAASSSVVTVVGADRTAPAPPSNLVASVTSPTQVSISWGAATDDTGVSGYYIVRNGVTIADLTALVFTDSDRMPSTAYEYYVMAYDAAGNVSAPSNTVSVTMPSPVDTTPPSTPAGLAATTISTSQINLNWTPSTDNVGVTGYDVYRDGQMIASPSVASFGDSGLTAGKAYTYYVIAKDYAGNSSFKSNEVTATTQSPPTTPSQTKATVEGRINNQSGIPISGANVSFTLNRVTISYNSAQDGTYRATELAPGAYTIKYAASGYKTYSYKVTIRAGETVTKNVTLIKSGR